LWAALLAFGIIALWFEGASKPKGISVVAILGVLSRVYGARLSLALLAQVQLKVPMIVMTTWLGPQFALRGVIGCVWLMSSSLNKY